LHAARKRALNYGSQKRERGYGAAEKIIFIKLTQHYRIAFY
jgi:hypothetical protein